MTPEAEAEVERVRRQHGDEAAAVVARFITGDIAVRRGTVRDRKVGRKPKTTAIPVTHPKPGDNNQWTNWDFTDLPASGAPRPPAKGTDG